MSNQLIQISKNLQPQTQHELQELNKKLQPHSSKKYVYEKSTETQNITSKQNLFEYLYGKR